MQELHDCLRDLGAEIPISTLKRWAYQKDKDRTLISAPKKRGKGKGKGSVAHWSINALAEAAGIWELRSRAQRRKIPRTAVIRRVQRFAKEVYTHPTLLLSIPDDTADDFDPPLAEVSFALDCPADVEPYLIPYIITMEKARHRWDLREKALVTFRWNKSAKAAGRPGSGASTRALLGVSVTAAPGREEELHFLVDNKDVREHVLESRGQRRKLRAMSPREFKDRGLGITKLIVWPLAVKPIKIDKDENYESALAKYRDELPRDQLRAALRLAYWVETQKKRSAVYDV